MNKTILLFLILFCFYSNAEAQSLSYKSVAGASTISITPAGIAAKNHSNNVAVGDSALFTDSGQENTAFGNATLSKNQGFYISPSLISTPTGNENTALGSKALYSNVYGSGNTALGKEALFSFQGFGLMDNTTIVTGGISNTAIGYQALYNERYASGNVAIGAFALYNNNLPDTFAPYFSPDGGSNVAVGVSAGQGNLTGHSNTYIGTKANTTTDNLNNSTALGFGAIVDASNKVRIGNANVSVIEGAVAWSNPSDRRLKENIHYNSSLGLEFIKHLRPVSYNYIADKSKVRYDGFIAQDVEKVMQDLGISFSGLKKSENGMYSLAYSDFVMPLVNAVKEQQKQIEDLKDKLAEKDNLKARIEKLEALLLQNDEKILNSAKK